MVILWAHYAVPTPGTQQKSLHTFAVFTYYSSLTAHEQTQHAPRATGTSLAHACAIPYIYVCMYVKIRRHQHTRVHAHTDPRRNTRAIPIHDDDDDNIYIYISI